MINFITRYFTSLWAFITAPFRAIWRLITRIFPPREFTVMDTPRGNVYTFQQSSFWRFTKFCGKIGLFVWATWSTYVFLYHRPMLQSRTIQLENMKQKYAHHMIDLQKYLEKYNELTKNVNVIDDKLLKDPKMTTEQKEALVNERLKTWGVFANFRSLKRHSTRSHSHRTNLTFIRNQSPRRRNSKSGN